MLDSALIDAALQRWRRDDPEAATEVLVATLHQVREIVKSRLAKTSTFVDSLTETVVTNEFYIRLVRLPGMRPNTAQEYFALTSTLVGRIIIEYQRRRFALKRGGGTRTLSLQPEITGQVFAVLDDGERLEAAIDLERALEALEKTDPRQAELVRMNYFLGLTLKEIAEVHGVALITAKRQWRAAKSWLNRYFEVRSAAPPSAPAADRRTAISTEPSLKEAVASGS